MSDPRNRVDGPVFDHLMILGKSEEGRCERQEGSSPCGGGRDGRRKLSVVMPRQGIRYGRIRGHRHRAWVASSIGHDAKEVPW